MEMCFCMYGKSVTHYIYIYIYIYVVTQNKLKKSCTEV